MKNNLSVNWSVSNLRKQLSKVASRLDFGVSVISIDVVTIS